MRKEAIQDYLTDEELDRWNFICFCIAKNYRRAVESRVSPLYVDALAADLEGRDELATMLRDIAGNISLQLQQEKNTKVAGELERFWVTLRDRERAETIERLKAEIIRETKNSDIDP